jgi:hypothetical protein
MIVLELFAKLINDFSINILFLNQQHIFVLTKLKLIIYFLARLEN